MNVFKYFCHQKPERSFQIKGHYFPICARCTGFYTTILIYMIVAIYIPITYTLELLIFSFLLLIPAIGDGTTQLTGKRESNNTLRFITGLLGGIGLMIIIKTIKFTFIYA